MGKILIETEKLCKSFGSVQAVQNVNLHVPKGSIYAFLGPNGAGKTTTIRLILGLTKPDEGSIAIFGENMTKNRIAHARKIGSLVEGPSLYPHLNADEMLGLAAGMLEIEKPKQRIEELLDLLNLVKARKRLIRTWSLGMKQRLGLALALLSNPELLILDEPTNGLDPAGIQEMRSLLKKFPEQRGMTVFLSSHLLDEVNRIATDVGIIKEGKLIFQGSLEELQNHSPGGLLVKGSDTAGMTALLQGKKLRCRSYEGGVLLPEVTSADAVAEVNRLLVENGVAVHHLALFKAGMEALFNELTGNGEVQS